MTNSYLSNLMNCRKRPSLLIALRIEVLTGGKVPCRSWFEAADFAPLQCEDPTVQSETKRDAA